MKKQSIILMLLALLATSCEKVIDVDPNAFTNQLVLNGVPSAGKQMFVYFAHSRFFLDTSNNHPAEAVDMTLEVNGETYRPISSNNCLYYFDYVAHEDDSVSITIDADGKSVTAATRVPKMPRVTLNAAYVNSDTSINLLMVNITLDDHPDHKNLYCFSITERDSGEYYHPYLEYLDTIDTVYTDYFFCYDEALTASNAAASEMMYGYPVYSQLLTSDANIDGKQHNTTFFLMLPRDTNEIQPFYHHYTLTVECVSPDRYQYLQDVAKASNMMSLITEPPAVHSNVQGALGIFAGTAKQTIPLITLADLQPVGKHGNSAVRADLPTIDLPREVTRKIIQSLSK